MPLAENNEVQVYYESSGSGEALVLAHGFTLDRRMWGDQVEYFSKNYQVVTFDSRGHGKSSSPVTGYSRDHRETDLLVVVDKLKLNRFHLIGLSMGGATAIGFAIDYPKRLKSLIMVSSGVTGYNPSPRQDKLTQIAREKGVEAAREKWLMGTMRYFKDKPGKARDLMNTMMSEHPGGPWCDPNRGKYTHRNDLELIRKLDIPTLIMVGALDLNFVPMGQQLNESIKGSVMEVFPDIGHMINLEAPEKFNSRLASWLEKQQ